MKFISIILLILFAAETNRNEKVIPILDFPEKTWLQYKKPEDAGWSSAKLSKAKAFAEKVGSANVLIIYKGAIVQSWGDASRRFCLHSARKATLTALYGIYIAQNMLDMSSTLAELGIDEVTPLTDIEKQATIKHLITCYSGIYLPSVIGGSSFPKRGLHKPGTHWYYNNWNFNALNTIFESKTKKTLTDAFLNDIAIPLQMEDFRQEDAFYIREKISLHPGYHINMSSRDLARFGLLYLKQGKWKEQQIVPEQWVKESLTPHSPKKEKIGLGYAWSIHPQFNMYAAEGSGGHALMVFPAQDLIIVHRTNTYIPKPVDWQEIKKIVKMILDAQETKITTIDTSSLISFQNLGSQKPTLFLPDSAKTLKFEKYYHNDGDPVTIKRIKGRLIVNIPYQGNFDLYGITDSTFYVSDKEEIIRFGYNSKGEPEKAIFEAQ
jgi:CubicO group peptidase (beta-lactamase class C family)